MGLFHHYQQYHLHEFVYSKNHIDTELGKIPDHSHIDTKVDQVNYFFLHCLFNKEIEHQKILFYGSMSEFLVPFDLVVKEVVLYVQETDNNTPIEKYSIVFNNAVVHSETVTQVQRFILPPDTIFLENQLVHCILVDSSAMTSNVKKAYLFIKFQKYVT